MDLPFETGSDFSSVQSSVKVTEEVVRSEEDSRKRRQGSSSGLSFYCIVLYTRDSELNCEVADFVLANREKLDRLFGRRLHGFGLELPEGGNADRGGDAYVLARAFNVGLDELPCAVLATSLEKPKQRLRLSFGAFMPVGPDHRGDDIDAIFTAITGAADRCADIPARRRVKALQRSLRNARRNVYGERAPDGVALRRGVDDKEAMARLKSDGLTVAQLLVSLASVVIGSGGVV